MGYEASRLFVGGEWQESSLGATFNDLNPATGEVWSSVPDAHREDAKAAIDAAAAAFEAWSGLDHVTRSKHLLKVAEVLESKVPPTAAALSEEGGGWIGKCMFEASYATGILRAAAAAAYQNVGEILPSEYGKVSMAVRRPLGVVSVISPWNFPLLLSLRGLSFALAAGNTIVLKPSEETPVTGGLLIAELFEEAGVPGGVLNVVTCSRDNVAEVGDELVANPNVRAISFTGSTAVGRQIAGQAGSLLKIACIEAGGKDALIILDDADMDRAVDAATFGSYMHQGQICMAAERLVVDQSIAGEFTDRLVERTKALKVGNPMEMENIIGPIINQRQLDNIHAQVTDAVDKGAKLLTGGTHEGLFYQPTVLSGVTQEMSVFRDETFGPVAPVIVARDEDHAVELANDCEYGLSSGIITRNEERGWSVANRLNTGMVHINDSPVNDEPHAPFGGVKSSGLGRHGGRWSVESFSETRWITLERGGRHYPF